jgi:hypothetical protein
VKTPKPAQLAWAEQVIALCDRFHVLPSAVLAEDAGLLRMLNLIDPECGKAD